MANAVLIDNSTLLLASDGDYLEVRLDNIASAIRQPTDVAVVPIEMLQVTAVNDETVDRQLVEQLSEGTVYCYRRLNETTVQVFSMQQELLENLRASPLVRSVVPYGDAVLSAQRSPKLSLVDRISRAVRLDGEVEGQPATLDVVTIDNYQSHVVVTALKGDEIKAVRALDPGNRLMREIFVTMQGAGLPESRVVTADRRIAEEMSGAGQTVDLARIQAETPSFAILGLTRPSEAQFFLPAERAEKRRQEVARRDRHSLMLVSIIFTICALAAVGMSVWAMTAQSEVSRLQAEFNRREPHLKDLYQQRYAGFIATKQFNLPAAWAELEIMMPPQLVVESVNITPGKLEALLERRHLAQGADPPLALKDLRDAMKRSPMWRDARVKIVFQSHEIKYALEKVRGPNR